MAGGHKFVFASKGPILFLAIANSRQSERQVGIPCMEGGVCM